MLIRLIQGNAQPDVDLTRPYDAIVIGWGAAGGMVAHVLTAPRGPALPRIRMASATRVDMPVTTSAST